MELRNEHVLVAKNTVNHEVAQGFLLWCFSMQDSFLFFLYRGKQKEEDRAAIRCRFRQEKEKEKLLNKNLVKALQCVYVCVCVFRRFKSVFSRDQESKLFLLSGVFFFFPHSSPIWLSCHFWPRGLTAVSTYAHTRAHTQHMNTRKRCRFLLHQVQ